ncbi:MAG: hypothetical protein WC489_07050 [Patescibacteria group bacterium]
MAVALGRATAAPRPVPSNMETGRAPSIQEAAHARPDVIPHIGKSTPELDAAKKAAEDLRQYDREHPDDERGSFIKRMIPEPRRLSTTEKKGLGSIQEGGKVAPEVQQVLSFEQYANVQRGLRQGMTLDAACQANGLNPADYPRIKSEVLDGMLQMKAVQEAYPSLQDIKDPNERRDYLETFLGSNPLFRAKVVEKARVIAAKAIQSSEKTGGQTSTELAAMDSAQQGLITEANKRLNLNGQELTQADLDAALKSGDPNEVSMVMYQRILQANGVNNPAAAQEYFQIRDNISLIDIQLKSAGGSEKTRLLAEKQKLESRQKLAEVRMHSTIALDRLEQIDAEAVTLVYGSQDRLGNRTGGMSRVAREMVDGYKKQHSLELQKKAQLTPEQTLAQETFREEIGSVMESAIVETLVEQQDELRVINHRKMEAEAVQAKNRGEVALGEAEEQVMRQMEEDGVKLEGGSRRTNKRRIGEKIRLVCEQGKEQAKNRLIMHDILTADGSTLQVIDSTGKEISLHMNADGALIRSDDGKPYRVDLQVRQPDGSYKKQPVNATYENIPLSSVTGQSKEILDTLVETQGAQYMRQLLVDFNYGLHTNNSKDIGSNADLKLSKDEQAQLMAEFGPELLKETQGEADQIKHWKRTMREHGVKMDMNILMTLIMLMGGFARKKTGVG